eukprot:c15535_g1_i1 orf=253-528(+)
MQNQHAGLHFRTLKITCKFREVARGNSATELCIRRTYLLKPRFKWRLSKAQNGFEMLGHHRSFKVRAVSSGFLMVDGGNQCIFTVSFLSPD